MRYAVRITANAHQDLREISRFIAARDGREAARAIQERLRRSISSLAALPNRGNVPPELDKIAFRAWREIHEPPYRSMYQVSGSEVRILCVLDARRNVRDVLERRVLR